jgi:hypothetical protein
MSTKITPLLQNILEAERIIPKSDKRCQTEIEDVRNNLVVKKILKNSILFNPFPFPVFLNIHLN